MHAPSSHKMWHLNLVGNTDYGRSLHWQGTRCNQWNICHGRYRCFLSPLPKFSSLFVYTFLILPLFSKIIFHLSLLLSPLSLPPCGLSFTLALTTPLAAADIFALNATTANSKKNLVVSSSFFEIYSGKVYDLLNKKERLRILEDKKQQVQIVGLQEEVVEDVDDVLRLIQRGNKCRYVFAW